MSLALATTRPPVRATSLWWAARALRDEVLGFRFDYPVEPVHGSGAPGALRYHVYSERLFFDAMTLGEDGVPVQRSRILGTVRNPAYVGWYGLMSLERSLRRGSQADRRAFFVQAGWLVTNAVHRADGAVVWPYLFDWQEGAAFLPAPWISAMAQGLAISVLVRAWRMTGRRRLVDLAVAATRVFEQGVEDGGVRRLEGDHVFYEEYPAHPAPRVLDGFLFGLLGLWDLAQDTGDARVRRLFDEGLEGLRSGLPRWSYRDRWSWYGSHGYLCPPSYNKLNAALLQRLADLCADGTIDAYARAWQPRRLGPGARAEVFLVFLLTKNVARLRFRRRPPGARVAAAE